MLRTLRTQNQFLLTERSKLGKKSQVGKYSEVIQGIQVIINDEKI